MLFLPLWGGENGEGAWLGLNPPHPKEGTGRATPWEVMHPLSQWGQPSPLPSGIPAPSGSAPLVPPAAAHTDAAGPACLWLQILHNIDVFIQLHVHLNSLGTGEPRMGVRELSSMHLTETPVWA